jgi:hypothetical protein
MQGLFLRRLGATAILVGLVFGFGLPPSVVQAAVKKPAAAVYTASVLALGVPRTLTPGQVDQVHVTIKNLGTTTWKPDGKNYVSLYRWNPTTKKEIASAFARPSWETPLRPTRLPVAAVAPNGEVSLAFPVRAPDRPGVYREQYILASEGTAWIARSAFDVELTVVPGGAMPVPVATLPTATVAPVAPSLGAVESSLPLSSDWRAELVDKGGIEWQVEAGDRTTAEVSFRNVGSIPWERTTGSFVSVYATDATGKKGRATPFVNGAAANMPVARLIEDRVTPGQIGHFKLTLRGPATAGFYKETFALAAENKAWIEGGSFLLPIRVPAHDEFMGTAPPDAPPVTPSVNAPTVSSNGATGNAIYAALVNRSFGELTGPGYGQKQFAVTFKNVSTQAWKNPSIRFIDLRRPPYVNESSLQDTSWSNTNEAVRLLGTTLPQDATSLSFTLRLPADQGQYTALFQLYIDGQPAQGGVVEIPLTVTSNASIRTPRAPVSTPVYTPVTPAAPVATRPPIEAIPLNGDVNSLPAEPSIRVGILRTADDRSVIQAMTVPVLVQQAGSTLCRVSPGQQVSVRFDRTSRVYILGEACTGQSTNLYLFRTEDGLSPMRVSDYDRDDNTFRAQLELRYTPATDSVWLINELPIEWYLKGIAETSNASPMEFKRTLLTTARTYAMYHVQRGTKHADESYTVDARYDQVYRGYGHELSAPTIAQAVDATRGQIVTYQGRRVLHR